MQPFSVFDETTLVCFYNWKRLRTNFCNTLCNGKSIGLFSPRRPYSAQMGRTNEWTTQPANQPTNSLSDLTVTETREQASVYTVNQWQLFNCQVNSGIFERCSYNSATSSALQVSGLAFRWVVSESPAVCRIQRGGGQKRKDIKEEGVRTKALSTEVPVHANLHKRKMYVSSGRYCYQLIDILEEWRTVRVDNIKHFTNSSVRHVSTLELCY